MKKIMLMLALSVLAAGASANEVFSKNCAACHANGGNVISPQKTLSLDHLKANGFNSVDDVKTVVSKGKAPMPGFAGKLSDQEIDGVSQYVWEQAQKGW